MQNMRLNVRDISDRVELELDLALIEKVVERSELWMKGIRPVGSPCRNLDGEYVLGCVEANNFPRMTRSYLRVLNNAGAY
jgi:hypothetical protein